MTELLQRLNAQYYYENIWPHTDPRVRNWLLVNNSPVYVLLLSALYLSFVWLAPKYMHRRKPFELRWLMICYNFSMVALSLYMFVEDVLSSQAIDYNYICQPYNADTIKNPKELRVAKVLWWYFFSKALEFMDTILMILRKKTNQVTFLHVFHHCSMLNIAWVVIMFVPGGQSIVPSIMNSLVHVAMYSYYGLAAFPSLREKLWWKKYLTIFQLAQFCIIFTHSVNSITSGCDFPKFAAYLVSGYMVLLSALFTNFYFHAYKKPTNKKGIDSGNNNSITNGLSGNGHVGNEIREKKSL